MGKLDGLFTETDNKTVCPIRVFGAPAAIVATIGGGWVFAHDPTGSHFLHVCTGLGGFFVTWSGAITGKSKLGGDANAASGPAANPS